MNSLKLTSAITVVAGALTCGLTPDEISLLSAILVQLGDTLATISAQQSLCGDDTKTDNRKNTESPCKE